MRILPEGDDADDFIMIADRVIGGLIHKEAPLSLVLIKTDNWFGSKWLGFSGKALGAIGVWKQRLIVPPFVPTRIVSQRKYAAPLYYEVDVGKPIHHHVPSGVALTRRISDVAPGVCLVWYSGNSVNNGRGCVMAYIPRGAEYSSWYAAWAKQPEWELVQAIGIQRQ